MCARIAKPGWRWSGSFQIQVGDFGLRMFGPDGATAILPVDISLSGASFLCVVGAPTRQPPYRIDNRQDAGTSALLAPLTACLWQTARQLSCSEVCCC